MQSVFSNNRTARKQKEKRPIEAWRSSMSKRENH